MNPIRDERGMMRADNMQYSRGFPIENSDHILIDSKPCNE